MTPINPTWLARELSKSQPLTDSQQRRLRTILLPVRRSA